MNDNKIILGKRYSNINNKLREKRKTYPNNDILKEIACTSIENEFNNNSRKKIVRNNDAYEQAINEVAVTYYKNK